MIDFFNQNIIVILALVLVLIIWVALLQIWLFKLRKKMRIFLKGKKVKDLEEVISEQLKRMRDIEGNVDKLFTKSKELKKLCDISIQKVGIIRFNPFKDTGGDQSFAISLLDNKNNGLVLSSLYTREGNRVYTKPIESGKSTYHLSKEEEEAIKQAIS